MKRSFTEDSRIHPNGKVSRYKEGDQLQEENEVLAGGSIMERMSYPRFSLWKFSDTHGKKGGKKCSTIRRTFPSAGS
jgi:hypothetical protein